MCHLVDKKLHRLRTVNEHAYVRNGEEKANGIIIIIVIHRDI